MFLNNVSHYVHGVSCVLCDCCKVMRGDTSLLLLLLLCSNARRLTTTRRAAIPDNGGNVVIQGCSVAGGIFRRCC